MKRQSGENAQPVDVARYYDAVSSEYFEQYRRENLLSGKKYPQNYYRLQILARRLGEVGARSVYEVGTGEGTPLSLLGRMGLEVAGCDIAKGMVEQTRTRLREAGLDPDRVQWGDIQDLLTLSNQRSPDRFDAAVAFGVMPHVSNDVLVLRNMRSLLRPGGRVFIEFRNKLFSLFTFNRATRDFILDDLLAGVSPPMKAQVAKELEGRLAMDLPRPRAAPENGGVSYDTIGSRFHNPFEIEDLFRRSGFGDVRLHWYHYHPAPPMIEALDPQAFHFEASRLEHEDSGWRGYFLCSAFIVEAEAVE